MAKQALSPSDLALLIANMPFMTAIYLADELNFPRNPRIFGKIVSDATARVYRHVVAKRLLG